MIDYTEFCEIMQVGGYTYTQPFVPRFSSGGDIRSWVVSPFSLFSSTYSKRAIIARPSSNCALVEVALKIVRVQRNQS